MPVTHPITQRDVAEACGLHPSTVCLALKNAPSIPEATRRKIQALAEELGYQPNVAARNLALRRTEKHLAERSLPIAWINQETRRDHWRTDAEARVYLEAAQRRAAEAGYHLEEIWTQEPGMNPARIVQILRARGVEGAILPVHRSFDFSLLNPGWRDLALVGMNDLRLSEWVDVVCPDFYLNTGLALKRLRHLRFERIGLVLSAQFDAGSNGLVHGCYLRHLAEASGDDSLPVCFAAPEGSEMETVIDWCEEYRPEVVLGHGSALAGVFRRLPGRPAWVQLQGVSRDCDAGIEASAAEIAVAAIDTVVGKMRRFERGLPDSTRLQLIKGGWQERNLQRGLRPVQTVVA